jgi:hypothetical protein
MSVTVEFLRKTRHHRSLYVLKTVGVEQREQLRSLQDDKEHDFWPAISGLPQTEVGSLNFWDRSIARELQFSRSFFEVNTGSHKHIEKSR